MSDLRRMPAVSTSRYCASSRVDHHVDGVARGARDVGDDRALDARQLVEQRGLAGVRAGR